MSNVIHLEKIETSTGIEVTLKEFASERSFNSNNTALAYEHDIKQFISYLFNFKREVNTEEFARGITRKNLISYRKYLLEVESIKPTSIKRKFSALKEFTIFLYGLGYDVDIQIFSTLKQIKSVNNSYEVLQIEEAEMLFDWIKNNEKNEPLRKMYYCQLAFDTGVRAEALNNLTLSSFVIKSDEVIIKGVDKGNKTFVKSISKQFYEDMSNDLHFESMKVNESIFNFGAQARSTMFKRAKKALGWENRNITFHSLKKGAVTHAYSTTKDILLAQKVGGHESVTTTQRYLEESEGIFQGAISNKKSIESAGISLSDFTKEQLIEAIMNTSEASQLAIKAQLLNKVK